MPSSRAVELGAAALVGAAAAWAVLEWRKGGQNGKGGEKAEPAPHAEARARVWAAIGGALTAAQVHLGDKLGLYVALRELCAGGEATTAVALARRTALNQRWLREWLAQQAAAGFVRLAPGEGDSDEALEYVFEAAYADVLADPLHPDYDVPLIQAVPCLVNRAKTEIPLAFQTGVGVPYNDSDVSAAIDRAHVRHIRNHFLVKTCPASRAHAWLLEGEGCRVADLGCGGGNLVIALARRYPKCTVKGFEISPEALALATYNVAQAKRAAVKDATPMGAASICDGRVTPLGDSGPFDVVTTLDVLHDALNPAALIAQVKKALKPGGVWLLAEVACLGSTRENVSKNPAAATMYAFSTCLCLASALCEPGGAGIGTLGFTRAVAHKMLIEDGGFSDLRVISEADKTRWFEITH